VTDSCVGVRVVRIPGSLRAPSYTRMAVAAALEGARALGAEARLIDLRAYALLFAGGYPNDDPPEAWRAFAEDGTVTDAKVAERLRDVGKPVTRFAFLHTNDKMREFLRLWEDSMPNPGGAGR
jgi:hypothetical protein